MVQYISQKKTVIILIIIPLWWGCKQEKQIAKENDGKKQEMQSADRIARYRKRRLAGFCFNKKEKLIYVDFNKITHKHWILTDKYINGRHPKSFFKGGQIYIGPHNSDRIGLGDFVYNYKKASVAKKEYGGKLYYKIKNKRTLLSKDRKQWFPVDMKMIRYGWRKIAPKKYQYDIIVKFECKYFEGVYHQYPQPKEARLTDLHDVTSHLCLVGLEKEDISKILGVPLETITKIYKEGNFYKKKRDIENMKKLRERIRNK